MIFDQLHPLVCTVRRYVPNLLEITSESTLKKGKPIAYRKFPDKLWGSLHIINIIFIQKHLGMLNQGKRYNSLIGYH